MRDYKNKNWLAWKYLADMLDDFFGWYFDEEDPECPITADQAYELISFIIGKMYVE